MDSRNGYYFIKMKYSELDIAMLVDFKDGYKTCICVVYRGPTSILNYLC